MSRTHGIEDPNGENFFETFHQKDLLKKNRREFRIEKVIKRKDDKLYVKQKGCDNSFSSWIDENVI